MFGFFRKKASTEAQKNIDINMLSCEEITLIENQIKLLITELSSIDSNQNKQLAKQHEQIGLKFAAINNIDQAIQHLETSLTLEKSIGDGYKKLMSLYNIKRAEAAKKGDDQGIELWMSKMDDMRNIAKQVTLSR